jgi:hypothetical protein
MQKFGETCYTFSPRMLKANLIALCTIRMQKPPTDRRNSDRRGSLVEAIPDLPTLKKVERPQAAKDTFTKELEDTKVSEGTPKVLLKCTFSRPPPKVQWMKNKIEIFQGPKFTIVQYVLFNYQICLTN